MRSRCRDVEDSRGSLDGVSDGCRDVFAAGASEVDGQPVEARYVEAVQGREGFRRCTERVGRRRERLRERICGRRLEDLQGGHVDTAEPSGPHDHRRRLRLHH